MEPSLRVGDVVLSDTSGGVDVGAIIVYESTAGSRIHRVVEVTDGGFRTKGDANPSVDSAVVPPADVRGTGVMLVPFVGLPRQWLAQQRWLPLAVATIAFGACLGLARRDFLRSTRARRRWSASA
jgi:signal peptidase